MLELKNLLESSVRRAGAYDILDKSKAFETFNGFVARFFGRGMLERVKAMDIKNKIMTVASLSEVSCLKIQNRERELIREINSSLQKTVVEKIEYLY